MRSPCFVVKVLDVVLNKRVDLIICHEHGPFRRHDHSNNDDRGHNNFRSHQGDVLYLFLPMSYFGKRKRFHKL